MKIELPELHSEPLIYFLLHSGVFVLVLAALFFLCGLWFGSLTWGKYKLQAKAAHEENQALLGEIAVLKRKVTEQSMRPTNTAAAAPALLTEVLPNVSEIFPERLTLYPALAAMPKPPVKAAPAVMPPAPTPLVKSEPEPAVVQEISVPDSQPQLSSAPTPEPAPVIPEPAAEPKIPAAPAKPIIRAKAKLPAPEEPLPILPEPTIEVEPFGFLLAEPEAPKSAPKPEEASALDSIIKGKSSSKTPRGAAKARKTTKVKLPPAPPPVTVPEPEMDPALGPIYRVAPPQADQLTQIKGIASILEKRLHELGVYTFHQIASWEDHHIREFSTRLAFKDRIAREGWVQQAQSLEKARQSA
jgi:predicted flap endonuclease-1-like 5' DNA nuclease